MWHKNKTGALSKEIVMDILAREAETAGLKVPVHVSEEEGDGLGYDIRSWNDANFKHVSIKVAVYQK